MLNTLRLFHELETTLDTRAAQTIADIIGRVYDDLQDTVTKTEFRELTAIVQDLGAAQQRTEARVEELAAAQQRTESMVQQLTRKVAENTNKIDDLSTQVGGLSATVGYGDEFLHKKVRRLRGAYPPLFPILITYMTSGPEVAAYANEKGVHLDYSYQFMDV